MSTDTRWLLVARKHGASSSRRQRRFADEASVERAIARWRKEGFTTWWVRGPGTGPGEWSRQWTDPEALPGAAAAVQVAVDDVAGAPILDPSTAALDFALLDDSRRREFEQLPELARHVGCGDLDVQGKCSLCEGIRAVLTRVYADFKKGQLANWARAVTKGQADSALFMNIWHRSMREDPGSDPVPVMQLGYAMLLDKPIVLIVPKGEDVPVNVQKAATAIEYYEPGDMASMRAATLRIFKSVGAIIGEDFPDLPESEG